MPFIEQCCSSLTLIIRAVRVRRAIIIKVAAKTKRPTPLRKMISRQQAASVVTDRLTYYDGMIRNGWLLPAPKQSICTLDFMQRVRKGEIYCPRVDEVKVPPVCITPPPKEILISKIMDAC